jgi:translocation and assembly module TamB
VRGFSALGSGHMQLRARGKDLDARGQISLAHGRLYALTTGQELSAVELTMTANGNWMKLDGVRARVGRGSLEAAGGISFEGLYPRRIQLGIVTNDLPIQREGLDLAWLTGSAAVIGEITDTHSHTAVKLHSLAVRLPNVSSRSPQSLEPHPDVTLTTEPAKHTGEAPYSFEFAIDGRDQLTAKRNDFEAALAAEVALEYREPDLHVGGYIEFRRGTFELFGKRFELNRGSMRFDGGTVLNPEISMVATHEPDVGGGSTVIANVSGTLAKPEVAFYAERCPGEGAVVLLLSGRCPSEEDSASGNPGATQEALAAGIIGGILTLGAQRQLSGLIPTIAVESSARGTRTRVKAGFEAVPPFMRDLVQRVYLQGAISTADQSSGATSPAAAAATPDFLLELYFPNNIVGAGRVAPTTHSWGLDVTWEP